MPLNCYHCIQIALDSRATQLHVYLLWLLNWNSLIRNAMPFQLFVCWNGMELCCRAGDAYSRAVVWRHDSSELHDDFQGLRVHPGGSSLTRQWLPVSLNDVDQPIQPFKPGNANDALASLYGVKRRSNSWAPTWQTRAGEEMEIQWSQECLRQMDVSATIFLIYIFLNNSILNWGRCSGRRCYGRPWLGDGALGVYG